MHPFGSVKKLFIFLVLLINVATGYSQTFWERSHIGIGVGAIRYMGDIRNPYTKFSIQGTYTYELTDHINLRGQIMAGSIGASDKGTPAYLNEWLDETTGIRNPEARPHPFSSRIQEASIMGEYNLLNMNEGSRWTPYGMVGLGLFYFTPYYTSYNQTENRYQNIRYNATPGKDRIKLSIPFGGGIKYALNDNVRLFAEGSFRYTTTDDIDAMAVQSSSKSNDYYYTIMVGLTFRLGKGASGTNGKSSGSNRKGCPPVYL